MATGNSQIQIKNEDTVNTLRLGKVTLQRGESQQIGNFTDFMLQAGNSNLPVKFSIVNLSSSFIVLLEIAGITGQTTGLPYHFCPSIQPRGTQLFMLQAGQAATLRSIPDKEAPPQPVNLRVELGKYTPPVLNLRLSWDFPYSPPSDFWGFVIYENQWHKKKNFLFGQELTGGKPITNTFFQVQTAAPIDRDHSYVYEVYSVDRCKNLSHRSNAVSIEINRANQIIAVNLP